MQKEDEPNKIRIGIMINSYNVFKWIEKIIQDINALQNLDLVLIIIDNTVEKKSYKKKFSNVLYKLYRRFDYKFFSKNIKYNAFQIVNIEKQLNKCSIMHVKPNTKGLSQRFGDNDINKIYDKQIDVLLKFGFKTLKGDILNVTKYGIWSYHHGDNRKYKGRSVLFWEIYNNDLVSGTVLQLSTGKYNDSKVIIDRTTSKTENISLYRNRNATYWKASNMMVRNLEKLSLYGFEFIEERIEKNNYKYNNKIFKYPTNIEMIYFLWTMFSRALGRKIDNVLFKNIWKVSYKINNNYITVNSSDNDWIADPFPFSFNGKKYLFYEKFISSKNKGVISCLEIKNDNKLDDIDSKIVLEKDYHLSFPNIFEYSNEVYMIPETKQNKTIELYKAIKFPFHWKFERNLMKNIKAVDSSILFYDKKLWLFTNISDTSYSTNDELYIFYADSLDAVWQEHKLNPVISDARKARNAGRIFVNNKNEIIRPSQDCSQRYGYALNINKIIKLTENEFIEETIENIYPSIFSMEAIATHTFNFVDTTKFYDYQIKKRKFI